MFIRLFGRSTAPSKKRCDFKYWKAERRDRLHGLDSLTLVSKREGDADTDALLMNRKDKIDDRHSRRGKLLFLLSLRLPLSPLPSRSVPNGGSADDEIVNAPPSQFYSCLHISRLRTRRSCAELWSQNPTGHYHTHIFKLSALAR